MPSSEQIRRIIVKKSCLTSSSQNSIESKHSSYSCSYCSKNFSSPSHLSRHILIHTGEKPCLCSECGQQFSQITSLERHQRTKHDKYKKYSSLLNNNNNQLYQCKLCQEYFSLKHNLKMHEKKLHKNPTNFFCNICSAYFTCNSSLQKHRNFRHRLLIQNYSILDNWTSSSESNQTIEISSINKPLYQQQQVHYQILKCNEIN